MTHRVVVTGLGVISALGDSPDTVHAALCEGRSGLRPLDFGWPEPFAGGMSAAIPDFDPQTYLGQKNFRPLDRTSQLAVTAVHLALDASGWSLQMRQASDVGLVLGTMFCSVRTIAEFDRRAITLGPSYARPLDFPNTVINAASGQTAIWHHLRGINSTIALGATSGLQAVAYAADLIRSGRAQAMLAGGVEEVCFESLYGFARAGLLAGWGHAPPATPYPIPFDARRNGFVLGEGAAFLMLEDRESALARGAAMLAEVAGYSAAYDPSHGQTPQGVEAISRAMRRACQDAHIQPSAIDCVSASANGSMQADWQETQAIAQVFQDRTPRLPVTAIKSLLGESLGASGALQVLDMIQSMQDGTLPGIHRLEQPPPDFPLAMASAQAQACPIRTAMINSLSHDGNCCALVLQQ